MRALVTGGAGFIGSHIVDHLVARGYDVRIYDSLELPTHHGGVPGYVAPAAELIVGDMRDRTPLREALRGVDVVLHQAATGGFTPRIAEYVAANSYGTAQLLEIVRDDDLPLRKIVVASSIAVYGEGKYACPTHGVVFPHLRPVEQMARGSWEVPCPTCGAAASPLPTDEETPVDPATPYAISKYDQERLVLTFGRETGLPTVALRYFVTYGPRQSVHNPYTGVCTIFSSRIVNGLPVILYEDGRQSRDFIFVDDVARANVFALEDPRAAGRPFNVGTGAFTTIRELAAALQRALGRDARIEVPDRYRPGEVRHIGADVGRLADLGFHAQVRLGDGLRRYVDWLSELGPVPEHFSQAETLLRDRGVVRSARARETS